MDVDTEIVSKEPCDPRTVIQTQQLTQIVFSGLSFVLTGAPQPVMMAQVYMKQSLATHTHTPIPLHLWLKVPLRVSISSNPRRLDIVLS